MRSSVRWCELRYDHARLEIGIAIRFTNCEAVVLVKLRLHKQMWTAPPPSCCSAPEML